MKLWFPVSSLFKISWRVSAWSVSGREGAIMWSPQTWMFASCIHGNVLWKHSSRSAWHEIPGVWWGMLSHQRPPITTPCTLPCLTRSSIQMKIDTQLKGGWDDAENSDLKSSGLCTQFNKRTCLSADHMKASVSWVLCPRTEWMFLWLLWKE